MPSDRISIWLFLLGIALMIGVFLLEVYTNTLETVAYIPIVLYMLWLSGHHRHSLLVGIVGTAFLIAGYSWSLSNEPNIPSALLANRVMAFLVVWFSVVFTIKYKESLVTEIRQRSQHFEKVCAVAQGNGILRK